MNKAEIVVGIDVGGTRKGFHAVALHNGHFLGKMKHIDPSIIINWCIHHKAKVIAIDAPCQWSMNGSSRLCERELRIAEEKIHCFATPKREKAALNMKGFYDWIFNGERLYQCLESGQYTLFDGRRTKGNICIETFPHAVVCAMDGPRKTEESKVKKRRKTLKRIGLDIGSLTNIDFVDAALCAVAADEFRKGHYHVFGDQDEGFIIVPEYNV